MTQDSATLLVLAACLLGVAVFALIHRRDAFGAVAAVIIGISATVTVLVAFSVSDRSLAGAAQLQAFAVLVEVIGVLCAAVGASLGVVLWRRTGADLVVELVAARPGAGIAEESVAVDERGEEDSAEEQVQPQLDDAGAEAEPGGPEAEDGLDPSSEGE